MKKMLNALALAATVLPFSLAYAQSTTTYSEATRQLTLPSVTVGNVTYSNVVLRLDNFTILAAGPGVVTPATGGGTNGGATVATTCTSANINTAKYNAIALGMTINQVNQTFGCAYSPSYTQRSAGNVAYTWLNTSGSGIVTVYFDDTGTMVTGLSGSALFKVAAGF